MILKSELSDILNMNNPKESITSGNRGTKMDKPIFITIAIVCWIMAIAQLITRIKYRSVSKILIGNVKEIRDRAIDGQTYYYPVIEYTENEKECLFESDVCYNLSKYKVGDKVELKLYGNGLKTKVRINTWQGIWLIPCMLIGFGVIFFILGMISKA